MNNTLTMNESVVLSLSTYNELHDKARMLDAIVDDTLGTIAIEPYKSEYTDVHVAVSGNLVLPAYVMDQILDRFVNRLANQDPDYIRSLVEARIHIFDFCTFRFKSYHNENNPLEFDLLKHPEFQRRWEQEREMLEHKKDTKVNNEKEDKYDEKEDK